MNHIFKTISKKIKGRSNTIIVVSENASSFTKTTDNRSHQETTSHSKLISESKTLKQIQGDYFGIATTTLKQVLSVSLASILFVSSLQADIIADTNAPINTQPIILNTRSGATQINIQTPTSSGISINNYSSFDTGVNGTVLNNSRTNANTVTAGWIEGNSFLKAGSAKAILNQVNSSNPSNLKGNIEIAGKKADLIIANPSGISIDGATIINAGTSTLTTGRPIINGDTLSGFSVNDGTLIVQGAGLNALGSDYTKILARSAVINAGIWANELNIVTGVNTISRDTSNIIAGTTTTPAPAFAIDSSVLGGMYANSINLIGTEAGVGVNNSGVMGVNNNISIDINGNLTNSGTIASSNNIDISSTNLTNNKTISSNSKTIIINETLTNNGTINSNGKLSINAKDIKNHATGEISARSNIINISDTLTNRGLIDGSKTELKAQNLDNIGTGRLYGEQLALQASTLNNTKENDKSAVIGARETLEIGATTINNIDNSTILSLGSLNIGGKLDGNDKAIDKAKEINNLSATIESSGDISLSVVDLKNISTQEITKTVQNISKTLNITCDHWRENGCSDISLPLSIDLVSIKDEIISQAQTEGKTLTNEELRAKLTSEMIKYDMDAAILYKFKNIDLPSDKSWGYFPFVYDVYASLDSNTMVVTQNNRKPNPLLSDGRQIGEESRYIKYSSTKESVDPALLANIAKSYIVSGGNITFYTDNLLNRTSTILAAKDIILSGNVTNESLALNSTISAIGEYGWKMRTSHGIAYTTPVNVTLHEDIVGSLIAAGGSITGNFGSLQNGMEENSPIVRQNSTVSDEFSNTTVDTSLPNSSLFVINPDNPSYFVQTDPRFTNYKNFISSDYMLKRLSLDPTILHKRLGDGYYEQKLIREQIMQLTGKRFLEGFNSDEEQYAALLNSGVEYMKSFDISVGVTLSSEQMKNLTTDIVLLVEKEITLSDGTKSIALVPQLYTAASKVNTSGSLIAANSINVNVENALSNSGRIYSDTTMDIKANALTNNQGAIKSNDVLSITTTNDIQNLSGSIEGNNVKLTSTNGSIINKTLAKESDITAFNGNAKAHYTVVGNQASISSDANLVLDATKNIEVSGAKLSATNNISLNAKDTIIVDTITDNKSYNYTLKNGYMRGSSTTNIASNIVAGEHIVTQSGRDTLIKGSAIDSQSGTVYMANINGDINVVSAQDYKYDESMFKYKKHGFLSSKKTTTIDTLETTTSKGSHIGGNQALLSSGNDINIEGSYVISDNGTVLNATNDINILASTDTVNQTHFKEVKKSGLFSSGGIGFTIGKSMNSNDSTSYETRQVGSMIGSLQGDTSITAENDYKQVGSSVISGHADDNGNFVASGDTSITAKEINIEAGYDTYNKNSITKTKQSGLTIAFTGGVISAATDAVTSVSDVGESKNRRVNAMATANAAYDVYQAAQAVQSLASNPNVGISITVGSSKSESKTHYEGENAVSSSVIGNNVKLKATADNSSDINIVGSDVTGVTSTTLKSDHNINIIAASSKDEQHSSNKSSGWNAGVAVTVGANGMSAGFTGGANVGKGKSDGESETYTSPHVGSLLGTTTLSAGDTTNIIGGQVNGDKIMLNTTNLNIESLQDRAIYDSKQMSANGQVTIGYGFSASGSYNNSNIKSDYASVNEQSGIIAGDKGYDVSVLNNTNLIGGIITSTQSAEDNKLNSFSTGTLTHSDMQNYTSASADGMGISGGYSWSNPNAPSDTNLYNPNHTTTKYDVGKDVFRNLMDNAEEGESSSSTTYSAISTDNVTITDNEAQQALTGKTASETTSGINHDTTNTNTTLEQVDYEALANDVEIQRSFYNNVSDIAIAFSDEAYRTMFLKDHPVVQILTDENGKIMYGEDGKPLTKMLTPEQAKNLQTGNDGKVNIALNGIFNDEEAAVNYAIQHANGNGPIYAIVFPEADNGISELMIAGYQKFMENKYTGLTNSTTQLVDYMIIYGESGLDIDAHSRGGLTLGSALEYLDDNNLYVLGNTSLNFFGSAYNVEDAANLLNILSNGTQTSVTLQNHKDDFVGGIIGGNPSSGGSTPEGSTTIIEWYNMFTNPATAHSCYGAGKDGCDKYWGADWQNPDLKTIIINATNRGKE